MSPLLILAIGIATVLGLILALRVHAFLALIVSAMVVSLLAPGPIEDKISRVASAFGSAAGSIAIVIGLAAIIGECMMASGAADRIVQSFLKLMGEKRASWALMGSGFVLAVPVFFDTVFYLLVPLARSLFRRTNKNYLLYILAIAAGGAITHTLVPPTPGPLVMASTLGIDVGVMILVGALVAFPAAIAGLAVAKWFDATMDIPFRDDKVVGTEDDDPHVPDKYPSLGLSLLPVVLPVILISANTALSTMANNERAAAIALEDVQDWDALGTEIQGVDGTPSPAQQLRDRLDANASALLSQGAALSDSDKIQVVDALNVVLGQKSPPLYDHTAFDSVIWKRWKIDQALAKEGLAAEEQASLNQRLKLDGLLAKDFSSLQIHEREQVNRTLLEVTFPGVFRSHTWETPLREAANVTSLLGNANLALLLSTVVAMTLLYKVQRPSLTEMSQTVEASLMSGGTIILITAAGGAFGAMLKTAQIGEAIKDSFEGVGGSSGLMFLFLGYLVASLMKIAQGSSTVAMITVSAMLAAMIGDVDLGFHPVYLATSIGAGSLMGSWMNDSGFWIFTKMGRLTETESLRSWTLMLMVLSIVSLGMSVLLATLLPLV